jgi:integrase
VASEEAGMKLERTLQVNLCNTPLDNIGAAPLPRPAPDPRRLDSMSDSTLPKRDSGWKSSKGIARRKQKKGHEWGYYSTQQGKIVGGFATKDEAVQAKANDTLRKSKGMPAPNTRRTLGEYIDVTMERKRRELQASSLALDERALEIMRDEIGHLKPGQCGPDRLEKLEADLGAGRITGNPLKHESVSRYMSVLPAVFKLAVRDGAIPASPMSLMERAKGEPRKSQFKWSREAINNLLEASEQLAHKPDARYDYSPLLRVLVLTGLRVSEALALRDIDLLGGRLHVEHSLRRDGTLGPPKTEASRRIVPLSSELVELLVQLIPIDAEEYDFVFHSKGNAQRPLSYFNFRTRGFEPALKAAGLDEKGITVHSLRHAAVSMFAWAGLTLVEVAAIVGHADASVTAKVYSHLFESDDAHARVRAAQASLSGGDRS